MRGTTFAFAFFQRLQHSAGAGDDRGRQSGKLCDLHAIGPVCRAFLNFVQEHDLAVEFLYGDGGIVDMVQLAYQCGQFVVVRGKQRAALLPSCRCSKVAQAIDRPS